MNLVLSCLAANFVLTIGYVIQDVQEINLAENPKDPLDPINQHNGSEKENSISRRSTRIVVKSGNGNHPRKYKIIIKRRHHIRPSTEERGTTTADSEVPENDLNQIAAFQNYKETNSEVSTLAEWLNDPDQNNVPQIISDSEIKKASYFQKLIVELCKNLNNPADFWETVTRRFGLDQPEMKVLHGYLKYILEISKVLGIYHLPLIKILDDIIKHTPISVQGTIDTSSYEDPNVGETSVKDNTEYDQSTEISNGHNIESRLKYEDLEEITYPGVFYLTTDATLSGYDEHSYEDKEVTGRSLKSKATITRSQKIISLNPEHGNERFESSDDIGFISDDPSGKNVDEETESNDFHIFNKQSETPYYAKKGALHIPTKVRKRPRENIDDHLSKSITSERLGNKQEQLYDIAIRSLAIPQNVMNKQNLLRNFSIMPIDADDSVSTNKEPENLQTTAPILEILTQKPEKYQGNEIKLFPKIYDEEEDMLPMSDNDSTNVLENSEIKTAVPFYSYPVTKEPATRKIKLTMPTAGPVHHVHKLNNSKTYTFLKASHENKDVNEQPKNDTDIQLYQYQTLSTIEPKILKKYSSVPLLENISQKLNKHQDIRKMPEKSGNDTKHTTKHVIKNDLTVSISRGHTKQKTNSSQSIGKQSTSDSNTKVPEKSNDKSTSSFQKLNETDVENLNNNSTESVKEITTTYKPDNYEDTETQPETIDDDEYLQIHELPVSEYNITVLEKSGNNTSEPEPVSIETYINKAQLATYVIPEHNTEKPDNNKASISTILPNISNQSTSEEKEDKTDNDTVIISTQLLTKIEPEELTNHSAAQIINLTIQKPDNYKDTESQTQMTEKEFEEYELSTSKYSIKSTENSENDTSTPLSKELTATLIETLRNDSVGPVLEVYKNAVSQPKIINQYPLYELPKLENILKVPEKSENNTVESFFSELASKESEEYVDIISKPAIIDKYFEEIELIPSESTAKVPEMSKHLLNKESDITLYLRPLTTEHGVKKSELQSMSMLVERNKEKTDYYEDLKSYLFPIKYYDEDTSNKHDKSVLLAQNRTPGVSDITNYGNYDIPALSNIHITNGKYLTGFNNDVNDSGFNNGNEQVDENFVENPDLFQKPKTTGSIKDYKLQRLVGNKFELPMYPQLVDIKPRIKIDSGALPSKYPKETDMVYYDEFDIGKKKNSKQTAADNKAYDESPIPVESDVSYYDENVFPYVSYLNKKIKNKYPVQFEDNMNYGHGYDEYYDNIPDLLKSPASHYDKYGYPSFPNLNKIKQKYPTKFADYMNYSSIGNEQEYYDDKFDIPAIKNSHLIDREHLKGFENDINYPNSNNSQADANKKIGGIYTFFKNPNNSGLSELHKVPIPISETNINAAHDDIKKYLLVTLKQDTDLLKSELLAMNPVLEHLKHKPGNYKAVYILPEISDKDIDEKEDNNSHKANKFGLLLNPGLVKSIRIPLEMASNELHRDHFNDNYNPVIPNFSNFQVEFPEISHNYLNHLPLRGGGIINEYDNAYDEVSTVTQDPDLDNSFLKKLKTDPKKSYHDAFLLNGQPNTSHDILDYHKSPSKTNVEISDDSDILHNDILLGEMLVNKVEYNKKKEPGSVIRTSKYPLIWYQSVDKPASKAEKTIFNMKDFDLPYSHVKKIFMQLLQFLQKHSEENMIEIRKMS